VVLERNKMNNYMWLKELELPKIVTEGLKLYGTKEAPGAVNNATILKWAKELGMANVYSADSIPWCGLYVAYVVHKSGRSPIKDPLWARNWAKWGVQATTPSLGDVLVFVRDGGGHVGIYIAEDATAYHVLGGNQSDAVTITRIAKNRCIAVRSPEYNNRPKDAKPYFVKGAGTLSTNEA